MSPAIRPAPSPPSATVSLATLRSIAFQFAVLDTCKMQCNATNTLLNLQSVIEALQERERGGEGRGSGCGKGSQV